MPHWATLIMLRCPRAAGRRASVTLLLLGTAALTICSAGHTTQHPPPEAGSTVAPAGTSDTTEHGVPARSTSQCVPCARLAQDDVYARSSQRSMKSLIRG
jgi:hypothetical protein